MDIKNWIEHISTPTDKLGGMSVCPFAKNSKYKVIDTDGGIINPSAEEFELIIYKLPDNYTEQQIFDIAQKYNNLYPELIFLPDPKNRETFINGVQTNNGKFNLILCQWRDSLNNARDKLSKTKYYDYWSEEYLKEIMGS